MVPMGHDGRNTLHQSRRYQGEAESWSSPEQGSPRDKVVLGSLQFSKYAGDEFASPSWEAAVAQPCLWAGFPPQLWLSACAAVL